MSRWLIYVRRSYKRASDAAVSDQAQEAACRAVLPADASAEVIADSGGHNSGFTDRRDGYRELLARVRAGGVDGIAVYDLSRLWRNATEMLPLRAELEQRGVALRVANLPATQFDGAAGRFMFGQLALAAQLQRDLDSERMRNLTRQTFEAGGHRGLDPFGYRTVPDVKPRTLEVVEAEAAVVRRVVELLARHSTDDAARILNAEGARHRADRPWTHSAVKDIWRRSRLYLGLVVTRRGGEERPGRHTAIITEAEWQAAVAAVDRRHRAGRATRPHRTYVLSGVLRCECGRTMAGTARTARGHEWRYYRCRQCSESVRAEPLEEAVVAAIAAARLPDSIVARHREELRRLLSAPRDDSQRDRLERRRGRLTDLFAWGHIDAAKYRDDRAAVDAALAALPAGDRILLFDRHRQAFTAMADAVQSATPQQLRDVVELLVAWARPDGSYGWTGPAAPFFAACGVGAPPDGLEPPPAELLAWYRAA